MSFLPVGGCNGRCGLVGGGDFRLPLSEHSPQYIATSPIMDLCLAAKRMPGPRVATRWWEQKGLDLEGIWTTAWAAEHTEGGVGDGWDGDGDGDGDRDRDRDRDRRLIKWKDNVENITLGGGGG